MATHGEALDDSVLVRGQSAVELQARILSNLEQDPALQVVRTGDSTVQVVRTYRPRWALFVGIGGLALGGLGLLFLLVKKSETFSITIADGPTGSIVTMSGVASQSTVSALRAATTEEAPPRSSQSIDPVPPPRAEAPSLDANGGSRPAEREPLSRNPTTIKVRSRGEVLLDPPVPVALHDLSTHAALDADETIARKAPHPARALHLRFADGRVTSVGQDVLVGRDPSPPEGVMTQLVGVDDPGRLVSKNHLAVRCRDGALWLEDLSSTNGTVVAHGSSGEILVRPGSPVRLLPGSVVTFGDHQFEVIAAE